MNVFNFNVPEKCLTCPQLAAVPAKIEAIERQREALTAFGSTIIGGLPEQITVQFSELLQNDHGLDPEDTSSVIQSMEKSTKQQIANQLNDLDIEATETLTAAEMRVERCAGTLSLRGSRGGSEYTVKVCGSTFHHNQDNPVPANLTIRQ